jgi:hypothetical protein
MSYERKISPRFFSVGNKTKRFSKIHISLSSQVYSSKIKHVDIKHSVNLKKTPKQQKNRKRKLNFQTTKAFGM